MPQINKLSYPGNIIFGENSIAELPDCLPNDSGIMLVTGKHVTESGALDSLLESLAHFKVTVFSGISSEPTLSDVDQLCQIARDNDVTMIIAVGGGSVMDAAKAAAILTKETGVTADFFYGKKEISGKGLLFIAIPTTSGTGTEITSNSVLIDSDTKIKKSIRHPEMVPDIAIVDPLLTLSVPPELTAASGLDAFTQAVESFISQKANAVSRALSIGAVGKIYSFLETAYQVPDDKEARIAMSEGSLLSGMAFSQSGLGAVHGLAHPIGSMLSVPHGVACATLLRPVLEWNHSVCQQDYQKLAVVCGGQSSYDFIQAVSILCKKLNIPETFSGFGLTENHFQFIIDNCRSGSMKANPRHMTDEDVIALLKKLF